MCVSRVCMFCYVYYANMVCEYMAQALSPNNYAATGRNSQKSASHYPFDMNDDRWLSSILNSGRPQLPRHAWRSVTTDLRRRGGVYTHVYFHTYTYLLHTYAHICVYVSILYTHIGKRCILSRPCLRRRGCVCVYFVLTNISHKVYINRASASNKDWWHVCVCVCVCVCLCASVSQIHDPLVESLQPMGLSGPFVQVCVCVHASVCVVYVCEWERESVRACVCVREGETVCVCTPFHPAPPSTSPSTPPAWHVSKAHFFPLSPASLSLSHRLTLPDAYTRTHTHSLSLSLSLSFSLSHT